MLHFCGPARPFRAPDWPFDKGVWPGWPVSRTTYPRCPHRIPVSCSTLLFLDGCPRHGPAAQPASRPGQPTPALPAASPTYRDAPWGLLLGLASSSSYPYGAVSAQCHGLRFSQWILVRLPQLSVSVPSRGHSRRSSRRRLNLRGQRQCHRSFAQRQKIASRARKNKQCGRPRSLTAWHKSKGRGNVAPCFSEIPGDRCFSHSRCILPSSCQ